MFEETEKENAEQIITVTEAAKISGVSSKSIREAINKNKLKAHKEDGITKIFLQDLEKYCELKGKPSYKGELIFDSTKGLYSIREAEKILNVNRSHIRNAIDKEDLKAHYVRNHVVLQIDDIKEYQSKLLKQKEAIQHDDYLTVKEAAKVKEITSNAIRRAVCDKKLKAYKIKGILYISREDLENYYKNRFSKEKIKHEGELVFDAKKGLYSVSQIAKMLNVKRQRIIFAIRNGNLKAQLKSKYWVIHINDLKEYQEKFNIENEKYKPQEKNKNKAKKTGISFKVIKKNISETKPVNTFNAKEAAKLKGISHTALLKAIHKNKLKAIKEMGEFRIQSQDLDDYCNHFKGKPTYKGELIFDSNKDLYSVEEVAKKLNATRGQIMYAIDRGNLKANYVRGHIVIYVNDIKEYQSKLIEKNEEKIRKKDLEEHCKKRHSKSSDNPEYKGELIFDKNRGIYSLNQVTKMLGVSTSRIRYAISMGYLKANYVAGYLVLHINDINEYRSKRIIQDNDLYSIHQVALALEIDENRIRYSISKGFLKAQKRQGIRRNSLLIHIEDIKNYQKKLSDQNVKEKNADQDELFSIVEAAKIKGVSRQSIWIAIKKKKLKAHKEYGGWKLYRKDLEYYYKSKHSRERSLCKGELIFDSNQGMYSVKQTAKILNKKPQHIYFLLYKGYLKGIRKGSTFVIHIDDIKEYQSNSGSR